MTDEEAFVVFHHKNPHGPSYEEQQLPRAAAMEEAREQVE